MERPAYLSSGTVKEKSCESNKFGFQEDHSCGTSWSAKQCYSCGFCNRKFRSAQALGGHMNVHRIERARMRLLASSVSESHNPNPKYKPYPTLDSSPSSSAEKFSPHTHHRLPSLSSPLSAPTDEEKKQVIIPELDPPLSLRGKDIRNKKRIRGVLGFGGFAHIDEPKDVLREKGTVSLDLEIGLLKDRKQDVDLELRLGCF
ncbi:hypothetical protein I3843_03G243500 [Carya illinoinensis]|uniref:C2H2-type domain-containing protein n=1 Tax=Carya illinoinensis TaxID=32201 RepID=A0A8T1R9D1_CARIL|nr:transcriptional regulator SUPERMAN-like [Carya illinoinensis]KAG2719089.1 hypothetical protein I3760_03G252200 [Carya illinoinensis]KAG6662691.1 hypothetical protein CIPAW_03G260900 [Carya illinoinensis]KAG6724240.1 hypothetical protein I3842_03G249800 [Carya illinoinensis]KAG7989519.1 hypothetical protein I3843_03G243500 [Carya illinoinensis]